MKYNIKKNIFWFFVILLPTLALYNVIVYPTYRYRYNDYHRSLIIEYKKDNKNVRGEVIYYWNQDMVRLHLRTKFTGIEIDNKIIIILEDNYFRRGDRIVGKFNKEMILCLKDNTINFMGIILN